MAMSQRPLSEDRGQTIGSHVWPSHCRAVLVGAIQDSCRHFPTAGLSAADIHSARRGLKKSYALTLLFSEAAVESCDAATAVFERVRKCLGEARDLDVMDDMLESLEPELAPVFAGKLASLLAAERNGHVALAALNPRNLCEDLQRQADLIDQWTLVHADAASIARALRRTYKSAFNRGRVAFEREDPHELHRLRKAVVAFRHQMDALAPAWPKLIHATATEAQHLRVFLGSHHDLAMLLSFAASREELQEERAAFAQTIAARQAKLVKKARASFVRLFSERPKAFERRLLACLEYPKRTMRGKTAAAPGRHRA
jgi:CHAD domain-containing protein